MSDDKHLLRRDENKSTVLTEFLVFQPGKKSPSKVRHDMKRAPGFQMLRSVILPLLGLDVVDMEQVSVLYQGNRHDMFVDEFGAITTTTRRIPKPVNEAATEIYHAYPKSRGMDMTDAASIHGVAVLSLRKVWF